MKTTARLCLLLATTLFFTGCGKNWHLGKWTLDRELTLSMISTAQDAGRNPGEGFLKDIVSGLQKGLSRILLTQFEGVEIEFTATEMRRVRNGVGEAKGYQIIERPDTSTAVLRFDDGEIVTWSKVSTGVRMKLPGDVEQWVYFKPVP